MIFADISKEALWVNMSHKKKNMGQYRINSICQGTIDIINYAQECAPLITYQGAVKKKLSICFNIKAAQTQSIDSEYFEKYI